MSKEKTVQMMLLLVYKEKYLALLYALIRILLLHCTSLHLPVLLHTPKQRFAFDFSVHIARCLFQMNFPYQLLLLSLSLSTSYFSLLSHSQRVVLIRHSSPRMESQELPLTSAAESRVGEFSFFFFFFFFVFSMPSSI